MSGIVNKIGKKIENLVLNNKKLYYIVRCVKLRNDKEFFDSVVVKESNKFDFRFWSKGNLCKDKIIYSINLENKGKGFFAFYREVLVACAVAERYGYIPYVEIKGSAYNTPEIGENVYEYYFEQYENLEKETVEQAYNGVTYNRYHMYLIEDEYIDNKMWAGGYSVSKEYIEFLGKIKRKYISVKPIVKNRILDEFTKLLKDKKTLAIHYRGTDYNMGMYGHPVSLGIGEYFDYINECLESGYEQIFIATDDEVALNTLIDKYGEKVSYYKDTFRSSNGIGVHSQSNERKDNGYWLGYEVLRDMLTLAKCDGLICGISQVTIAAMVEKASYEEEYSYLKIIDKGLNKEDNIEKRIKYKKQMKSVNSKRKN